MSIRVLHTTQVKAHNTLTDSFNTNFYNINTFTNTTNNVKPVTNAFIPHEADKPDMLSFMFGDWRVKINT